MFIAAPKLTDEDVQCIIETTAKRIVRLCQRRGLLEEADPDQLFEQEPLLATLIAASVQGTVATGDRVGQRVIGQSGGTCQAIFRTRVECRSADQGVSEPTAECVPPGGGGS